MKAITPVDPKEGWDESEAEGTTKLREVRWFLVQLSTSIANTLISLCFPCLDWVQIGVTDGDSDTGTVL